MDDGTLYEFNEFYAYRWSPVAAWILGFVTLMPLWLWQVLHVAVLPLLRSWWLVVACLITFPLWFDIQTGNLMIFIAVTGFWAYRGNGPATALFLVLTLLVPRPLMIPLAAWILWNRPPWRLPFLLLFVGHAALVVASGYAGVARCPVRRVGRADERLQLRARRASSACGGCPSASPSRCGSPGVAGLGSPAWPSARTGCRTTS